MKIVFLLILTLFLSSESAYVLERVSGIDGYVVTLEFDSDGNAYFFSVTSGSQFSKLNATKNVLWEIGGDFFMERIFINSLNDVYLDLTYVLDGFIAILREDARTFEPIGKLNFPRNIFTDKGGNLFYNGMDGVYVHNPNLTAPILVKNLESHYNYDYERTVAIDDTSRTIYFAVADAEGNNSIAILTKEGKEEEIPSAELFDIHNITQVDYLSVDDENNLWVFVHDSDNSYIKKFNNNSLEDIHTDGLYQLHFVETVEDRVYFGAVYMNQVNSSAFFMSSDGAVHEIPELNNVPTLLFVYSTGISDSEGNLYFGFYYPWDEGQILIVRPDGTNNTWIEFPKPVSVAQLVLDENENLWIGTGGEGIFVLEKGETNPIQVSAPTEIEQNFRYLQLNKKTNEIFVLTMNDGLYFVRNDLG